MSIERDRLISLIEFSQQSARLRGKPAATVAAHGLFALYEHELQGLPGVRINVNGSDTEDEIWLTVERLHETRPPEFDSAVLKPWVQFTPAPTEEPRLREVVDGAVLIDAGDRTRMMNPTTWARLEPALADSNFPTPETAGHFQPPPRRR